MTSHNFCTCNPKSWYLVIFSSSFPVMFWSPGTAISVILHSLFSLPITTISGLRCSIYLFVWIAKSQSILHLSFSSTGSGWCENHMSSHSISNFLQRSQCTFFSQVCCVSSCIPFELGQNKNWQYGRHFQLSLCRVCIAGTRPGHQCHFLLHLF